VDPELAGERAARLHALQRAMGERADGGSIAGWEPIRERLLEYLRLCGIAVGTQAEDLLAIVRQRLRQMLPLRQDDDPVAAAVRELLAVIDAWLAEELAIDPARDRSRLLMARAALLAGGAADDWPAHVAQNLHGRFAARLRAVMVPAVPEQAGLNMPTQDLSLRAPGLIRDRRDLRSRRPSSAD
jgi:hypothetical protein